MIKYLTNSKFISILISILNKGLKIMELKKHRIHPQPFAKILIQIPKLKLHELESLRIICKGRLQEMQNELDEITKQPVPERLLWDKKGNEK